MPEHAQEQNVALPVPISLEGSVVAVDGVPMQREECGNAPGPPQDSPPVPGAAEEEAGDASVSPGPGRFEVVFPHGVMYRTAARLDSVDRGRPPAACGAQLEGIGVPAARGSSWLLCADGSWLPLRAENGEWLLRRLPTTTEDT